LSQAGGETYQLEPCLTPSAYPALLFHELFEQREEVATGGQPMHRITKRKLAFATLLALGPLLILGMQPLFAENQVTSPEIKKLGVPSLLPGKLSDVMEFDDGTISGGKFIVPVDKHLVISRVKVVPEEPGPGMVSVMLWHLEGDHNKSMLEYWVGPNDQVTYLDFPGGLVISPESSLAITNGSDSNGPVRVDIAGYIRTDE
jgi:hypothetical protein